MTMDDTHAPLQKEGIKWTLQGHLFQIIAENQRTSEIGIPSPNTLVTGVLGRFLTRADFECNPRT
jgi:hypothetical protein